MTFRIVGLKSENEAQSEDTNVIRVAACLVDNTLNKSNGVLGNCAHFTCRHCGAMYTQIIVEPSAPAQ